MVCGRKRTMDEAIRGNAEEILAQEVVDNLKEMIRNRTLSVSVPADWMARITITRTKDGMGGYMVNAIKLKNHFYHSPEELMLVVGHVDLTGPAHVAGLNKYRGWKVVQVDGIDVHDADEAYSRLEATKKPYKTFELTLMRLFSSGSRKEAKLLAALQAYER